MDTLQLNARQRAALVAIVIGDLGNMPSYKPSLTKEEKTRLQALEKWLDDWIDKVDDDPAVDEHVFRDIILSMAEEAIREERV